MIKAIRLMSVSTLGFVTLAAALSGAACSSSSSPTTTSLDGGTTKKGDSGGTTKKGDSGGTTKGDSGGTTKKDSGGGNSAAVMTYCTSLVAAEAKTLSTCAGGSESAWQTAVGEGFACTEVAAAVAAGRATFNSTQAAACLTALGSLTCTATTQPAACGEAIVGTVANGKACEGTLDCAASSFCGGLGGPKASCSGTCKARLTSGESCGTGDACIAGYTCSGNPGTCTANASLGSMGQACLYNSATKSALPGCQIGLACDLMLFQCVAPVASGGSCTPSHGICTPFTYCDGTSMTCTEQPGAGGSCGAPSGQDLILCTGLNYCNVASGSSTGTCAALGGSGATCSGVLGATQCLSGACSATDGGTGTCFAPCTAQ